MKKFLQILHSIRASKIKRLTDREWNKKIAWANIRSVLGASKPKINWMYLLIKWKQNANKQKKLFVRQKSSIWIQAIFSLDFPEPHLFYELRKTNTLNGCMNIKSWLFFYAILPAKSSHLLKTLALFSQSSHGLLLCLRQNKEKILFFLQRKKNSFKKEWKEIFFHYLFFDKENFMMTWWPKSLCERESILKCLRLDTNLDGEKKKIEEKVEWSHNWDGIFSPQRLRGKTPYF